MIVVLAVIRVFSVNDPTTKIKLYTAPFIVPVFVPIIIQHIRFGRAYLAVRPLDGLARTLLHLRQGSSFNGGLFALICLLPILISSTKGLLSYLSIRRLMAKSAKLTRDTASELFNLLDDLVSKSQVVHPQLILLNSEKPTAFAYGFYRPTLAVSDGLHQNAAKCPDSREQPLYCARGYSADNVLERRGEICIMKTVGWTSRDISRQIIGETFLQSLIGGLVGLGLGSLAAFSLGKMQVTMPLAWGVNPYPNFLMTDTSQKALTVGLPASISLKLAALAIALSVVVGLLSALLTTKHINRIKPAEVLHYE